jgi:hypothetical protein
MDHSLGDAICGRPFFENTLGDEILDFFLKEPVNVIIPAHYGASLRLKTYSWGRNHGGFGRNARTAEARLWRSVCSGQAHPAQRARIIEKTWPAVTKKGLPSLLQSSCLYAPSVAHVRRSRAHWKRDSLLLLEEAGAAALTRQVQVAPVMDGKLDPTFEQRGLANRDPHRALG